MNNVCIKKNKKIRSLFFDTDCIEHKSMIYYGHNNIRDIKRYIFGIIFFWKSYTIIPTSN